jgi:tetratricopeptide (TPR) repeat protein
MTWDTLGYAHSEHGQYAEAADACGHAIEIFNEIGDRYNHAESLTRLGGIHQATGELPAAREAWRQAYTILAHLDHPRAASTPRRPAADLPVAERLQAACSRHRHGGPDGTVGEGSAGWSGGWRAGSPGCLVWSWRLVWWGCLRAARHPRRS